MIIELANVVIRPKAIKLTLEPGEMELDVDGVELKSAVDLKGETEIVDDKVHVRGTITAETEIACIRCLVPVEYPLDITFDDIFVDPSDAPSDAELALEAEDLDVAVAIDGRIDLAEVIREQILLALPDQLFCTADCKGLCPKCGSNRNLLDCKCIENEIDPRWSALKDFR
ncbi:MAG: DUF177 domain-containing protein [Acidobacteriota bacterium]